MNNSLIAFPQSIIITPLFTHLRIPGAFLSTKLCHNLLFQLLITHMIPKISFPGSLLFLEHTERTQKFVLFQISFTGTRNVACESVFLAGKWKIIGISWIVTRAAPCPASAVSHVCPCSVTLGLLGTGRAEFIIFPPQNLAFFHPGIYHFSTPDLVDFLAPHSIFPGFLQLIIWVTTVDFSNPEGGTDLRK